MELILIIFLILVSTHNFWCYSYNILRRSRLSLIVQLSTFTVNTNYMSKVSILCYSSSMLKCVEVISDTIFESFLSVVKHNVFVINVIVILTFYIRKSLSARDQHFTL